MTRAELMRHALSQALRRVHIGPKKLKFDEETRWQIAGEAVELNERGRQLRRPPCFANVSGRLRVYGSSETNFRYSASGHARAVLVCTLPREPTARQNLATASPLGASITSKISLSPWVR